MATFRLSAHEFEISNGFVQTSIFATKAKSTVEAATLPELETKIAEFGKANAPCNVWVGAASKPKLRGFDKWNDGNGASKWLFEPATVTNAES